MKVCVTIENNFKLFLFILQAAHRRVNCWSVHQLLSMQRTKMDSQVKNITLPKAKLVILKCYGDIGKRVSYLAEVESEFTT